MAELDVQPKSKSSWLTWLLVALVLAAILFFLVRGCDSNADQVVAPAQDSSEAISGTSGNDGAGAVTGVTTPTWDSIDFNAPETKYDEVTDRNISVRGNDSYAIYSIGENVLFNTDKSTIRSEAQKNLKELSASISKRFNGGEIRVYGYTDSTGSKSYNKELAEKRAEEVRNWLVKNGNVDETRVSLHPVGESRPVASNESAKGRQQNRRVEIVARRAQNKYQSDFTDKTFYYIKNLSNGERK